MNVRHTLARVPVRDLARLSVFVDNAGARQVEPEPARRLVLEVRRKIKQRRAGVLPGCVRRQVAGKLGPERQPSFGLVLGDLRRDRQRRPGGIEVEVSDLERRELADSQAALRAESPGHGARRAAHALVVRPRVSGSDEGTDLLERQRATDAALVHVRVETLHPGERVGEPDPPLDCPVQEGFDAGEVVVAGLDRDRLLVLTVFGEAPDRAEVMEVPFQRGAIDVGQGPPTAALADVIELSRDVLDVARCTVAGSQGLNELPHVLGDRAPSRDTRRRDDAQARDACQRLGRKIGDPARQVEGWFETATLELGELLKPAPELRAGVSVGVGPDANADALRVLDLDVPDARRARVSFGAEALPEHSHWFALLRSAVCPLATMAGKESST